MSFKYKILQQIAVLSESQNESKQVNVISYNDTKPKIDISKCFFKGDGYCCYEIRCR